MGQPQTKYHITDDGKIFSVMLDGSVSEIGNVSSLNVNNKTDNVADHSISRKWMWIAIVSWIILTIVCITFYVNHNAANDYIYELNNQLSILEQNVSQTQSALLSKSAELDSINQQIYQERQNRIPITITDVQFANVDYNDNIIDNYGNALYSSRMCFLKPRISFTGRKSGTYTLTEKIIQPDGTLLRGDSSPENATQSFQLKTSSGRSGKFEISSWGWSDPGNYETGRWTLQIWYDNVLVYSTYFDVY